MVGQSITGSVTVEGVLQKFVLVPVEQPEILPSLLPLLVGWIVIELYFGKHENESLGWNTSVSNAVLWIATGLSLSITGSITTVGERNMTYFLIGLGIIVAYMNFFHRWSEDVAYRVSSADAIYPLAYVTVVIVRTDLPVNETVLKACGLFIIGSIIFFRIVRMFEPSARDGFDMR